MRSAAKRTGLHAVTGLALLAAVISLVAWMGTTASDNPAEANHQVTIGLDTNTTGNSALALGSLEACRVINFGEIIDIDLYIQGVDDIASFETYIKYDTSKIIILGPGDSSQNNNDQFLLQQAQATNNFQNVSETLPDSANPGIYRVGGADLSVTPQFPDPDPVGFTHKDGVLVRLQIRGNSGLGGFSTLQISQFPQGPGTLGTTVVDSSGNPVGDGNGDSFADTVLNASIVVGSGDCVDNDGDGVPDSSDNCPSTPNATQDDFDNDGSGDACDTDDDNDGLADAAPVEQGGCQFDPDCDNDLISDGAADPDGAGSIEPGPDNCALTPNFDQTDTNFDGEGDACDTDDDGDGILDGPDNCPLTPNFTQDNMDGDSLGDACDDEDDGDGFSDAAELAMGTNRLDNCGNAGPDDYSLSWPADLKMSGVLPTLNKVDIQDLQTFILPVRRINSSVGDPEYHARWDLVPGPGPFGNDINIQDLTKLVTFQPLMFGGNVRAFNGATCTP